MAFNVRHPVWLPAAPKPGIRVFAGLYTVETFARASIATVLPIQAYDLLASEQRVSFAYTFTAFCALAFSLAIPFLIRNLTRRWVYSLGALALLGAAFCFTGFTEPGLVAGMVLRVTGAACLNVTLSLYILDHIRKQDYVLNDSVRLGFGTLGWVVAPYLGVLLYTRYGPGAAYLWSGSWAALLFAVFWYLRLTDGKAFTRPQVAPANPLRYVRRFWSQPRLRLAWLIAWGRSSCWSTFFVYAPLLMVTGGMGKDAGGLLVSLGNAMLVTVLLWGRHAGRFGVRKLSAASFGATGVCLLAAGYFGAEAPMISGALLLASMLLIIPTDAVGTVPFYRAVHPHERAEMTAVYRSYMDLGELLPQLVYGVLLGFWGIGAVFVALGALLIACALASWLYLPRRL
ncbi:MAG TPA: MFS transporter [Thermohalobaculum sp.]|nr:MFS transporter [Thermohalobaculum sp.]